MSQSKKRKRMAIIHARVTEAEKAEVAALAKTAGGVSALFRAAVLGYKPPKSRVEIELLARGLAEVASLKGAINKVGTNINQIAKEDNMGRDLRVNSLVADYAEFRKILEDDFNEMRMGFLRALGQERNRKLKD